MAAAGAFTAVLWLLALSPSTPKLDVTFMDVGEGMCVVVRSPSGRTMVVDCGTSTWRKKGSVGDRLVAPYLQSLGVDDIDVVVLSHPHEDHLSGMPSLLGEKPAHLVLDSGTPERSRDYRRFLWAVKRSHATYRIARPGQRLDLGGGAVAEVLAPNDEPDAHEVNERCIVLRVRYGSTAVLLTADADEDAEEAMLKSRLPLRSQVLQVGHHGSSSSSSPAFLARVRPAIAVISCAQHNSYGHPSPAVVTRLRAMGARVYTTARSGAVEITSDGSSISVRTFGKAE